MFIFMTVGCNTTLKKLLSIVTKLSFVVCMFSVIVRGGTAVTIMLVDVTT